MQRLARSMSPFSFPTFFFFYRTVRGRKSFSAPTSQYENVRRSAVTDGRIAETLRLRVSENLDAGAMAENGPRLTVHLDAYYVYSIHNAKNNYLFVCL